jgi:hypothetical protein
MVLDSYTRLLDYVWATIPLLDLPNALVASIVNRPMVDTMNTEPLVSNSATE